MEKNNNLMSGKGEKGKWITVNGAHVFIEDGQSVEDAMNKHFERDINNKDWTGIKTIKQAKKLDSDIIEKKLASNIIFSYGKLNMTDDELTNMVDKLTISKENYNAEKVKQFIKRNRKNGGKIFTSYQDISKNIK
mgnify:CR=1 FL=1